jgi:hypothetical protein
MAIIINDKKMNLKYSILPISALMFLVGCSSDITSGDSTERLELGFNTSLSSAVVSRASANQFAANSELLAFVRHVEGASKNNYNDVDAELDRLVTLKVNADESVSVDGTPLYWDDFSKSAESDKDIRATNHGLQSYYGYCYNGGTYKSFTKSTGELEWTAVTAPTSATDIQHTDLLWSAAQDMITYSHASVENGTTGTLSVPFTHAMSEFTVVLNAEEGYSDKAFENTSVTLHNMNSVGSFIAPLSTVVGSEAKDFTMYSAEDAKVKTRTYIALTVPGTALYTDNLFLTISNAEGNNYTYKLSADNLSATSWGKALAEGKTLPGNNYKLTLTLNKSGVSAVATLADWVTVEAEGDALIDFTADVKSHNIANKLTEGNAFNLWMTAATYTATSTRTAEYTANGLTLNSPIYWPNGTDTYYFRAEANYDGEKLTTLGEGDDAKVVNQGQDRVWATTAEHKAPNATKTYNAGEAIAPRTGSVPFEFKHVMSKVIINLTTPTAEEGANEASTKHVDLTDATLSLSNVYPSGELDIHTGAVTATGTPQAITATNSLNEFVVPQATKGMVLTVTLKDGTKYTFNLANAKVVKDGKPTTEPISLWEQGNVYTYTINISKQAVELLGYVKDWVKNEGSGNAELIWDDDIPTE